MVIFTLEVYNQKDKSFGVVNIKHNPSREYIKIPIGSGKDEKDVERIAVNTLKCIESDLKRTIEIIEKQIESGKPLPKRI